VTVASDPDNYRQLKNIVKFSMAESPSNEGRQTQVDLSLPAAKHRTLCAASRFESGLRTQRNEMTKEERAGYYQALLDVERGVACFYSEYAAEAVKHVTSVCRGYVRPPWYKSGSDKE
jgi:hypothetical protein